MKPDIHKMIEETLKCLDGIKRAEPSPFFYTRVIGKLHNSTKTIWELAGSFLARPVIAMAGILIILVMNILFLLNNASSGTPATIPVATQNDQITTDNEYVIASTSSFDYENIYQQ